MKQLLPLLLLLCLSANAQEKFTVYFDTGKDVPTQKSGKQFSEWLEANKDAEVQDITAFTDTVGNTGYNDTLSVRRFKYVFVQLDINRKLEKFSVHTPGERESLTGTNAENRRAVITYAKPVPSGLDKQVSKAKKGDRIRLENLNFYENSTTLLPTSLPVLKDLLAVLKAHPSLKIEIQGHVCCQVENEEKLSYRRARLLYEYLVDNGINAERLSHSGFGSTKPIYPLPEKNEQERVINRRVEIEIIEI
jgi:outer membrane protein OmpA-like peptidoglycan-associated protein